MTTSSNRRPTEHHANPTTAAPESAMQRLTAAERVVAGLRLPESTVEPMWLSITQRYEGHDGTTSIDVKYDPDLAIGDTAGWLLRDAEDRVVIGLGIDGTSISRIHFDSTRCGGDPQEVIGAAFGALAAAWDAIMRAKR